MASRSAIFSYFLYARHYNVPKYFTLSLHYFHSIGIQISNIINFGEDYIDFVVCHYNNRSYYYLENHPIYDLIMNAETNVLFSQGNILFKFLEYGSTKLDSVYSQEENLNLDQNFIKLIAEKQGVGDKYSTEEKTDFIINYLKIDEEEIKKKDFLSYLDKKNKGQKTYIDRSIKDEDLILLTEDNEPIPTLEKEEDISIIIAKKEEDPIKDLLKQEPNLNKVKDIADFAKIWKQYEPIIRKIILNIKNNPVSPNDVVIVHNEISLVFNDKKYFTDAFKDYLVKYIKTVFKKYNEPKLYEDAYQDIFDKLPLSDLNSAKNIKELKKLFEGSHKEIIRDILECPGITLTREEIEQVHEKILHDVSDSQYPFFDRLKKSLCHFKKGGDDQDAETIMKQWYNIELILQMNNLSNIKDILKVREFFISLRDLIKTNFNKHKRYQHG